MRAELQRLKRDTDSGRSAAVSAIDIPAAPTPPSGPVSAATPQSPVPAATSAPSQPGPATSTTPQVETSVPSTSQSAGFSVPSRAELSWKILVPAVLLIAVLTVGGHFYALRGRPPRLTEKDFVLVTDFTNTTGDPVFDGTLRKGLTVGLEQSPFVNIVPDQKVQETLKFMGRGPEERVSTTIGREICQGNGIKAMITGSIASLGSQYVVTLDAVNVSTGDSLGREQVQAASKEQVLSVLGKATASIRQKLGESLASVEKFYRPLEQATTFSLEALKAFTQGDALHSSQMEDLASIPFYQRAIELDPNFALAFARLGTVYNNLDQFELSESYLKQAMDQRERASERERFYIEAHYYDFSGQMEKAKSTWELYHQTFPRDLFALDNLAGWYQYQGQFEKALALNQEEVRLNPDEPSNYSALADTYRALNRLDESKATVQAGFKHGSGGADLAFRLLLVALAQGDHVAEQQARSLIQANSQGEMYLARLDARLASSHGQLRTAQEHYARARDAALSAELKETAANWTSEDAILQGACQDRTQAAQTAAAALALSKSFATRHRAAIAYALAGMEAQARALNDEVLRERPNATYLPKLSGPLVQALLELNHGNAARAAELLRGVESYTGTDTLIFYSRAMVYLRAGLAQEALQDLTRLRNLYSFLPDDPYISLARLGQGRAYAALGEKSKSREAYQPTKISSPSGKTPTLTSPS